MQETGEQEMVGRLETAAFLVLAAMAVAAPAVAQDAKKPGPAHLVVGAPGDTKGNRQDGELTSAQVALVQKVSAYFNAMSGLKGDFVQTNAAGKRLRGKFYVKRPGRFRFDFARPSRLVIVSDGRHVAIQDHDLKTEDRWQLEQTPFGTLLRQDVDLLRDARLLEVQDAGDTIVIAFEDKTDKAPGALKMFFAKKPTLELKSWITKDLQGLDTQIELSGIEKNDEFDADFFKPAPIALEKLRR
ncbi:MAG TPA: outer membrane lipoprotein carrier protein LolA [Hyphomicrobiaceae bacterium]|nr:outer membrane lipoprotein carrier protein LolA [Hyphomicrobiaceae bacterium]